MTGIKVEFMDLSPDTSCFICLQQVPEEKPDLLLFLFNYLKIDEKVNSAICQRCADNLIKFQRLSNILEKVRLEMDYILDFIQSKISIELKQASIEITSARESVKKKCKEKMSNPKPQILLERAALSTIKSESLASNFTEDFTNSENDFDNRSTSGDSDFSHSSPTPVKLEDDHSPNTRKKVYTKNIKCTKCPITFRFISKLKAHYDAVHLRRRPFKCPTCSKLFFTNQHLKAHIDAIHLHLKPYTCDTCHKSFAHASALNVHKCVPKPEPETPFPCEKCGKTYDNIKSLKNHEYQVQIRTEKKYSCKMCNKIFRERCHLYIHFSSVHQKQKHCCKVSGCEKMFSYKNNLFLHYRRDHPDFIVPQRQVNDFYSGKYAVINSNGISVVECVLCRGHFKSVKSIKEHLKSIHGCVKFKCPHCKYGTQLEKNFNIHIKHKHK